MLGWGKRGIDVGLGVSIVHSGEKPNSSSHVLPVTPI